MKKYFMFALATVAMLSVSSCMNEKDFDLAPDQGKIESEGYGYISLNVSSDDEMATRAIHGTNVTGDYHLDASEWTVVVTKGTSPDITTQFSGTVEELASNPFAPGTDYAVAVSNYANLAAALAANGKFGDAYYEGATTSAVTVTTGATTTPEIACGQAQNAKLAVSLGTLTGITITSISVVGDDGDEDNDTEDRTVSFYSVSGETVTNNTNKVAYYMADDELTYHVTYTTNNKSGNFINKITLGAHTSNTLSITSTDTGLITLTITYNDVFGTGQTKTVTIDAATGNATVTPPAS